MGAWFRWLKKLYQATFSGNVRYAIYPVIDDIDIAGTKLTSKSAKKMDQTAADIFTAVTGPQVEYWICSVLVHTVSAAEIHGIELQNAAAVKLFDHILQPTAKTVNLPPYDLPFPIKMNAKAVVKGILGSVTGAGTAYVALLCATLL